MEVSQLDTTAVIHAIEDKLWSDDLIDQVMKYGRNEHTSSVYLSKLAEREE